MKSLKSIAEPPTQKVDTSVTSKAPKRIKTSEPNLCIASNSGAYFFRQGKIEHKLGHFPNLKQAIEAKRIYEIKVNNHGALAFRLTMRDVYEDYLEFRRLCSEGKIPGRRQIAKGTLKEGQDVFRLYLLPFFGDEKLAKITPRVFEAYTKKSGRTDLSNIRKVLVHFLGWCEQQEYITGVPKFVIPHLVRRQRRVLTDNELKALLANAHGSLKLFISCYLLNGMRAGEIITLKWSDVDFERRVIRLQKQNVKTRKAREMPANQHVLALMQYRKATQAADKLKTEFVFPNRKNPKRHADKTGLKGSWNRCKERAGLGDL